MLKRGVVLFLCLALVLAFAATAIAGPVVDRIVKNKVLVVGTSADYPPLNFKATNGKAMGLDMDLATILAKALKVKLKVKIMPFPKLIGALQAGKVDMVIAGMTMLPLRNLKITFAGPYFVTGQGAVLKGEMMTKVRGLQDLNQPMYTVAVSEGTTGEITAKQLMPKAKLLVAKDMEGALQAVLTGKAQVMVTDFPFCVLASFRHRKDNLAALEKPFTYEPLGVAVSADDPQMLNLVNNFIGTMGASGGLDQLKIRWFKKSGWMKNLPADE
ncbi:MAG: transporter substrate-binding domain-containing protein [Desulfarculaceae bacterium]|nr:transporter substrate-binding domain-containing protein [Desulfarculaceae bacterium]MCF8074079.1 transporter substrate-binding domain-containing protein [Desulfarculaceae bacterium]MCF8102083.1 transporter substrate-binding domain-containing protein [Desulfarculaceae bacterium]MCF8118121.1 transporter substrate-binding domain-containing protein [Desulfarculaceae bacterium]